MASTLCVSLALECGDLFGSSFMIDTNCNRHERRKLRRYKHSRQISWLSNRSDRPEQTKSSGKRNVGCGEENALWHKKTTHSKLKRLYCFLKLYLPIQIYLLRSRWSRYRRQACRLDSDVEDNGCRTSLEYADKSRLDAKERRLSSNSKERRLRRKGKKTCISKKIREKAIAILSFGVVGF